MPKTITRLMEKIAEINRRYAEPRVTISPAVRASLFFLRFYLIGLVVLMVYKFILLLQ